MHPARLRRLLARGMLCLGCGLTGKVQAGGSGLNTVVVLNQSSSNSCELANYYCERRAVPPENVLRLNWPAGGALWTSNDFQINLLGPLLNLLATRQLSNQVTCVVLSMDIPSQTANGPAVNSTTSTLFYGLRANDGSGLPVVNSFAKSETSFDLTKPANAPNGSFLATMLTAHSLAEAKQLVDQGVNSDGTFPGQPVVLAKSSDTARNLRYTAFDNAIFNATLHGYPAMLRTNTDSLWAGTNFLGYETGLARFSVPTGAFVPGAIADSLTSWGGIFDAGNDQTNLLAFISAGAAGSYGCVSDPGSDAQRFPDPLVYFYQARGFSLAESYYQSIPVPYMGLVVAEPLAAPFALPALGSWSGELSNVVLSGTVPLAVQFTAHDPSRPLAQIDLFIDGKYQRTLTNLAPCPGNVLSLTLNNFPLSYTVPSNATPVSIATDLAALLNASTNLSATRVVAYAHGDRVELQSLATNYFASPFYTTTGASGFSTDTVYRADYVTWPLPPVLGAPAPDPGGGMRVHLNVPIPMSYMVQASSDLVHWTSVYTNAAGNSVDFLDPAAAGLSKRFYRLVGTAASSEPTLSVVAADSGQPFQFHIEPPTLLPYVIQTSTNLQDWTATATNQSGGPMDFADAQSPTLPQRFYRVLMLSATPGAPTCSVANWSSAGGPLLRVDGALSAYAIEISTNAGPWVTIFTNPAPGGIQTTASSALGYGSVLSSFLSASRPAFTNIDAQGYASYVLLGSVPLNASVQVNITKTNGSLVSINLTNYVRGQTLPGFAAQLCAAINTNPALQGADGLAAEDYLVSPGGNPQFNLRARSPGLPAAALTVTLKRYGITMLPSGPIMLTNNLGDLRARNHLYVGAGAQHLEAAFTLDTTLLGDGFHDLTAVAYEGNSVRTQTRVTVPVLVTNSPLQATLTLLDLAEPAAVGPTYHIQVDANTNAVSTIRLFTTGGLFGSVTNQSTALFSVDSTFLGAGLHPFYALVDTPDGRQYRTQTRTVRFVH